MGRLWKVGDKVQLKAPIVGYVTDVLGGGLTEILTEDGQDYISADEEYWEKA